MSIPIFMHYHPWNPAPKGHMGLRYGFHFTMNRNDSDSLKALTLQRYPIII